MRTANRLWREQWVKVRLGLTPYHPDVHRMDEAFWDFCLGFASCPSRGERLVLYGNNGNGKTRFARAVRRFVADRAMEFPLVVTPDGEAALASCLMVNWAQQLDDFKRTNSWDITPHINASLLILDDLGAEHDPSRVGLEKLYLILERREFRWTLITTNKLPLHWESSFERRVADRLFRNCKHVDLSNLPSYASA